MIEEVCQEHHKLTAGQEKILTEIQYLRRDINGQLKTFNTHVIEARKYRPWIDSAMEVTKWSKRVIVFAIVGGFCAWVGMLIRGSVIGS